ncbi:cytoglobin-1-like [Mytilus edulis]|uniref:cytoglobin-1-like n=1 Tax=Mytilus edulis TaxID=6550 RepID=UPI0039F0BADF
MGNKTPGKTKVGKENLNMYLTPRQRLLVQANLDDLKDDLSDLGLVVFVRFFEVQPKLKVLFPKIVRINDQNELELGTDIEMLRKHASIVMHSLAAAIESLDESEALNSVLLEVGRQHVKRNVKSKIILRLWPALSYGLESYLKEKYTKESSTAWKKVFFYIVKQMKLGMMASDSEEEATTSSY